MKKKIMKAVSVLLSVLLVAGLVDNSAFATAAMEESEGIKRIVRFLNAPEDMNVPPGIGEKNLALPETLFALVTDEAGEEDIIAISDVSWHSDDYEPYTIGIYEFTALFPLPVNVIMIEEMGDVMLRVSIVEGETDDEDDEENVTDDELLGTLADEENTAETADEKKRIPIAITSFAEMGRIKVEQGAVLDEGWLPGDIPAYVGLRRLANHPDDVYYVAVESWAVQGQAFDAQTLGLYEFVPVLALAEHERLAEDIVLPVLEVEVVLATFKTMATITFAGGNGTADNPYQIATAAQLAALAREVNELNETYNDKHYILNNDIDLSAYQSGGGWMPIGDGQYRQGSSGWEPVHFKGQFNGDGNVIRNLLITDSNTYSPAGLFGATGDATISNLGLDNVNININVSIGAITGVMNGGTIMNCYATDINLQSGYNMGGIAGTAYGGNIVSCYTTGSIIGSQSYSSKAGGIVGFGSSWINKAVNIDNSFSAVNISVAKGNTGGIAGELISNTKISDCYTTGDISNSHSDGDWWGFYGAGGIVGVISLNGVIERCYATGNVTGTGDAYAGGVAGYIYAGSKGINNAALNSQVSGAVGAGRITGGLGSGMFFTPGTLEDNYALNTMQNAASNTTWTDKGSTGIDGIDTTQTDLDNPEFWKNTLNFSEDIWRITSNNLPTLKATQPSVRFTIEGTEKTYNGQPQGITVTSTEPDIGEDYDVTYNGLATEPTDAGTYQVRVVSTHDEYLLGSLTATLVINKADISVKADDQRKYQGSADPTWSLTIEESDWKKAGDRDDLKGDPAREPGEAVGFYAITIGTLNHKNYNINFTPGLLEIVEKATVSLSQSYVLLGVGETVELTATVGMPDDNISLTWESGDTKVATVNDTTGRVTAVAPGSTIITAHNVALDIAAECRIDVIPAGTTLSDAIESVRLLQTSISHNALNSNPAVVPVQLVLSQNMMGPLSEGGPTSQNINNVKFTNSELDTYFTAVAVDDRRIELRPKTELKSIPKATSIKTKLELTFTGGTHTTENELTVRITKSTPTFKFAAIRLNSFFPDDAVTVSVTSTAGQIESIKLAASSANADNDLVIFDSTTRRLTLQAVRANNKNPKRLTFDITVEGFEEVKNVPVKVSVSNTRPTAKLSASTVSMRSSAYLRITSNRPIESIGVWDKSNKNEMDDVYDVELHNSAGYFTLSYKTGVAPRNESLRLRVGFADTSAQLVLPLSVRIPPANPGVKLSRTSVTLSTHANAAGNRATIHLLPNPVDLDMGGYQWTYLGSGDAKADNHISITQIGRDIGAINADSVSLKSGALPGTYRAELMDGSRRLARLSVKVVAVEPKVSFKAKGSLDIIDPESSITLTPKFTNYVYNGDFARIVNGENSDFRIVNVDSGSGVLTLQIKDDGRKVARNIKQAVSLEYLNEGGSPLFSGSVNITPKQSKPRLTQSTKRIDLQKNDRYSEGIIDISVQKPLNTTIERVEINGTTDNSLYEIRAIQNGRYALGFKGNNIGNVGSGKNIKLAVYFAGSNTPVNISVKVVVN